MYITDIKDIKNDFLEAVMKVLQQKNIKMKSLYMDKEGGIAITFFGTLKRSELKFVIQCITVPYVPIEYIQPESYIDYEYRREGNDEYTVVYSTDGIDYRIYNK